MISVENPDTSLPHGICQPGSVRLQAYLMDRYQLGNSGCYNPNSRLDSGAPSFHTTGQGIDLTCNFYDPAQTDRGMQCFQWVLDHKEELDLQQIIADHQIWSSFDQRVKLYSADDHMYHIHISLGSSASVNWVTPIVPLPLPEKEEIPMHVLIYDNTHHTVRVDQNGSVVHGWFDGTVWEHDMLPLMINIDPNSLSMVIDPRDNSLHVYGQTVDHTSSRHAWWNGSNWGQDAA